MERNSEKEAITLLVKAAELDKKRRKTDAFVCYKEGIDLLMQVIKELKKDNLSDDKKKKLVAYQTKVGEYMDRAEQLKSEISSKQEKGQLVKAESVEKSSVKRSVYLHYIKSMGFRIMATAFFSLTLSQVNRQT